MRCVCAHWCLLSVEKALISLSNSEPKGFESYFYLVLGARLALAEGNLCVNFSSQFASLQKTTLPSHLTIVDSEQWARICAVLNIDLITF